MKWWQKLIVVVVVVSVIVPGIIGIIAAFRLPAE